MLSKQLSDFWVFYQKQQMNSQNILKLPHELYSRIFNSDSKTKSKSNMLCQKQYLMVSMHFVRYLQSELLKISTTEQKLKQLVTTLKNITVLEELNTLKKYLPYMPLCTFDTSTDIKCTIFEVENRCELVLFYEHLTQTFCSIFECIEQISSQNLSSQLRLTQLIILQQQINQIINTIALHPSQHISSPIKQFITQQIAEYTKIKTIQIQNKALNYQYEDYLQLKNQCFRTKQYQAQQQEIIYDIQLMLKQFLEIEKRKKFKYKVLGAIKILTQETLDQQKDEQSDWQQQFLDSLIKKPIKIQQKIKQNCPQYYEVARNTRLCGKIKYAYQIAINDIKK